MLPGSGLRNSYRITGIGILPHVVLGHWTDGLIIALCDHVRSSPRRVLRRDLARFVQNVQQEIAESC